MLNSPTVDDTRGWHHLEHGVPAPGRWERLADLSARATLFRFNRVSTT